MKLSIDPELCQGHGRCVMVNMELFDMDDDAKGLVVDAEPGPEFADDIAKAIATCPEQAITYA
jgi:ferredoxin